MIVTHSSKILLDRGYGRPVQGVSGSDRKTWVPFTLQFGDAVVREIPGETEGASDE